MNNNINQQIQILLNQFNVQNFQHVITNSRLLIKKNPTNIILYNLCRYCLYFLENKL